MIKKSIQKQIDATIKEIWTKNIPKDFEEGYIINEDCLKISLCYPLFAMVTPLDISTKYATIYTHPVGVFRRRI